MAKKSRTQMPRLYCLLKRQPLRHLLCQDHRPASGLPALPLQSLHLCTCPQPLLPVALFQRHVSQGNTLPPWLRYIHAQCCAVKRSVWEHHTQSFKDIMICSDCSIESVHTELDLATGIVGTIIQLGKLQDNMTKSGKSGKVAILQGRQS